MRTTWQCIKVNTSCDCEGRTPTGLELLPEKIFNRELEKFYLRVLIKKRAKFIELQAFVIARGLIKFEVGMLESPKYALCSRLKMDHEASFLRTSSLNIFFLRPRIRDFNLTTPFGGCSVPGGLHYDMLRGISKASFAIYTPSDYLIRSSLERKVSITLKSIFLEEVDREAILAVAIFLVEKVHSLLAYELLVCKSPRKNEGVFSLRDGHGSRDFGKVFDKSSDRIKHVRENFEFSLSVVDEEA
ncbi:hypothetical protein Tco_1218853 [Tanacetum coccineum]